MKEFVNENLDLERIQSRKEVRCFTLSRELTTIINLVSMIHISGSEFGNSSLVVELWLAV
jgi:hypothetical protein